MKEPNYSRSPGYHHKICIGKTKSTSKKGLLLLFMRWNECVSDVLFFVFFLIKLQTTKLQNFNYNNLQNLNNKITIYTKLEVFSVFFLFPFLCFFSSLPFPSFSSLPSLPFSFFLIFLPLLGGGCKMCGSVEHFRRDCPELLVRKTKGNMHINRSEW